MSFANIFYILGTMIVSLAGLTLLPMIVAAAAGETNAAYAFFGTLVLTGFVGGGLIFGLRDMPRRSGIREAVFLVLIAWLAIPLFASLPFSFTNEMIGFSASYFEAVSALTTTGATIFGDIGSVRDSILIWRASLQWLGGLGTLLMGVGVFTAISFSTLPVAKPPVRIRESQQLLNRLRPVFIFVATTYATLTITCFVLSWATGLSPFDAFCVSLSTISTGGFMTRDGSFGAYEAPGTELVITIFMIIGATNMVLHHNAPQQGLRGYARDPEVRAFFFMMLIVSALIFTVSLGDNNPSRHLFSSIFNATSLLSTTGFAIGEGDPLGGVPMPIILATILIGGSALSTAGGLKLIRFILLTRHMRSELNRLAHPHSLTRVSFGDKNVSLNELTNLWTYFVCFTALLALIGLALSAFGLEFTTAFSAAAAALSNAGPALQYAAPEGLPFHEFTEPVQWVVIIAMILGRIEVLALLPIFSPTYWDN